MAEVFTDEEVRQARDLVLVIKLAIDVYSDSLKNKNGANLAVIYTALCMVQVFMLKIQASTPIEELEDKMGTLLDEFWTLVDREALKL